MHSKHLLKYVVILALLMFTFSVIPVSAQQGGEDNAGEQQNPDQEGEGGEGEDVADDCDNTVEDDLDGDGDRDTDGDMDDDGIVDCGADTGGNDDDDGGNGNALPTDDNNDDGSDDDGNNVENDEGNDDGNNNAPTENNDTIIEGGDEALLPDDKNTIDDATEEEDTDNAAEIVTSERGEEAPIIIEEGVVEETDEDGKDTLAAADDVDTAALPGSFTSQIIAVANLSPSGSSQAANLVLDQINGAGGGNVSSSAVFPGGVAFIRDSNLPSNGQFSGVLSSGFPAAAAVLTVNSVARVADAYPGRSSAALDEELFALGILNKHANFESSFYCQNAGNDPATITARFFETGKAAAQAQVTSKSLAAGEAVKWNIGDTNIQNQWPGGTGKFGYARFNSANPIACIVDTQRTVSPHVQAIFPAVPSNGYASTSSIAPGIFNGHGSSSSNSRGLKFNSGIAIVNPNSQNANVKIVFNATNGYSKSCSATVPGGSMVSWAASAAGTSGNAFSCTGGPLAWSSPGPTVGTALVTSNRPVMGIVNSNKYDGPAGLGAGYSSLVVGRTAPTVVTKKAVCPLAFRNDNASAGWNTGIQAVNVGAASTSTNITFKLVKAGANPTGSNTVSLKSNGLKGGQGVSAELFSALQTNNNFNTFEGAVYVTSSSQPIAVVSSSANYTGLGAAALYDCVNY